MTDDRPLILVLEDMKHRVDQLFAWVPDANIVWTHEVQTFLEGVARMPQPALVILDHDLGGVPRALDTGSRDRNGETGMDAARRLPMLDCPVIVWSVNPVRAPLMADVLRDRGFNAGWVPFGSDRLHVVIGKALASRSLNDD